VFRIRFVPVVPVGSIRSLADLFERRDSAMSVRPTTSIRRRLARLLTGLTVAMVAAVGAAGTASADPFGLDTQTNNVPGVGGIPDDFQHSYCFEGAGWTAAWQQIVNGRMDVLENQTSYAGFEQGTTCSDAVDVRFQLSSTISDRGDYVCAKWFLNNTCNQAIIRINSNSAVLPDDHQKAKTVCHEIGHSVGLAHGNDQTTFWNDCMLSGVAPAGAGFRIYNQHHIDHANSRTPAAS